LVLFAVENIFCFRYVDYKIHFNRDVNDFNLSLLQREKVSIASA